jgi:hypothetical protein
MTELKFRAKILQDDKPELIYFDLFDITNTFRDDNVIYIKGIPIIADTIEQFINKTDKNGKDIYDKDILKLGELVYQSYWDTLTNGWNISRLNAELSKVIGNVTENPELLEVK